MDIDFKAFRRANNLTQEELATSLECTQGFISQMERGISAVPSDVISKILAHEEWDTSMFNNPKVLATKESGPKKNDDMELGNLLAAIQQHGEELRKQGERLDRVLDLVSRRESGVVPASSDVGDQKSPPPQLYVVNNQLFIIKIGAKTQVLVLPNRKCSS